MSAFGGKADMALRVALTFGGTVVSALGAASRFVRSRSVPISMMPVPMMSMVRVGLVGIRSVSTLLKRGIRAARHLTVTVAARGCVRPEVGHALCE